MSKINNFQTLHCHPRSLDSASTLEAFIKREKELDTGLVTVTDHGYLGACMDAYKLAKKAGISSALGIEAYHRDDNCQMLTRKHSIESAKIKEIYKYGHVILHALDQPAYECLVKTVSKRDLTAEQHGSERKPIFTWEDLEEICSHNVTVGSACLVGIVGRFLMADRPDIAEDYYVKLRSIVKPGNFYVELMPHRCDKNWVSGVFITLENGSEALKYYSAKKLKTTQFEEISAADLAKEFKKGKDVGKLLAVKNYRTWEELKPGKIIKCEQIQDFIQNECRPWAEDGDVQLGLNKFMLNLANKYHDKVTISDDSHYAYMEDSQVQDSKLGGMGDSFRFYGKYHRQTSEEAYQYFKQFMGMSEKEFASMVDNNGEWASRFKNFSLKYKHSLPTSFYPSETLKHFIELINRNGRMDWNNKEMVDRLNSEIELLHNNGTIDLLPYFFLGEEVRQQYIQKKELPGPGRGSAAGLLTCYLLNITDVDPLPYKLSQDRFLTKDRIQSGSFPDIDFDFGDRTLLIGKDGNSGWLKERFGDCTAQISTDTLLGLRSTIKDFYRAEYGFVSEDIEKLCGSIPTTPQGIEDIDFVNGFTGDDGKEVKGLLSHHNGLQAYTRAYPEQWKLVQKALGVKRSNGRHASARVVCDRPLSEFIPLMTVNGVRVTQYTAESCEAAGAIKMDFLGINSLLDIEAAIKLVQKRYNIDNDKDYYIKGKKVPGFRVVKCGNELRDIWDLPEDQDVYHTICEGRTETVFQFCTDSAIKWLKEFNYWKDENQNKKLLSSIEDLAVFTALDRPGALDIEVRGQGIVRNGLQEYAARARGNQPLDPIPFLIDNLPETHGSLVFQEQLQYIYQKVTNCTGIEANTFRTKIAKKKMEEVLQYYPKFIERATVTVGAEQAQKLWDVIYTWGQYGFNKSHAVAYVTISYACAYLKYHYPLEWWCAVLKNADKDEIATKFWPYCRQYVILPDIANSRESFEIVDGKIQAPLSLLVGVGDKAHDELNRNKPYQNLEDFCKKIQLHKDTFAKMNEKTGKIRKGTSALNSGVVNKLILGGVMESLFPPNLSLINKLELYQATLAQALGKKRPEKVDESWANLNSLDIYLHKKQILSVYPEYLPKLLMNVKIPDIHEKVVQLPSGNVYMHHFAPNYIEHIKEILKQTNSKTINWQSIPFVNAEILRSMNDDCTVPDGGSRRVAVAAYVTEYRKFQYRDKKTNQMTTGHAFSLDIEGELFKFVKWPKRIKENEKIKLLTNYVASGDLEGGIIVALLSKDKEFRPFQLDTVIKVYEPLKDK